MACAYLDRNYWNVICNNREIGSNQRIGTSNKPNLLQLVVSQIINLKNLFSTLDPRPKGILFFLNRPITLDPPLPTKCRLLVIYLPNIINKRP